MTETIQIGDKWYVAATEARSEESPQALKHDESFGLFDRFGDVPAFGSGEHGLYHEDTRYLSKLELRLDGARPLWLGSTVKEANSLLAIDLMNPDFDATAKGTLHLFRAKLLWRGASYEHLRIANHGSHAVTTHLSLEWDADFVDLFEVRGMKRARRGERLAPELSEAQVVLAYMGLDGLRRQTRLVFNPVPDLLEARQARFTLRLQPGSEQHLFFTVACESGPPQGERARLSNYNSALASTNAARAAARQGGCTIETSNPLVNLWIERSLGDLAMLTTALPTGPYPYAGVPWYSTTFGRDGLLTARSMLWFDPSIARGVLAFLASTQAEAIDAERDAEPGKILHEARRSEMALTREIPFGRYYGTVDATPLFVALAGAYWQRTGDLEFMRGLWPCVLLALDWIDRFGDVDGDGFVEYQCKSKEGLAQQGWKDSQDSIFHADGSAAAAPIALCEVQGYVFEAKLNAAHMAQALGDLPMAARLRGEAARLQERFQAEFWCEEIGSYAIALDGQKRPCAVRTSNSGHPLASGIAAPAHAARIASAMVGPEFYNGWGIRTVASAEARYNPMSYHNGSVWPHDNALIAMGMARYGHTAEAVQVMSGLFEATLHFDSNRLPELFCGFPRREDEGPVLYPVACSPQAWSAAALFGLLQACLGLHVDAERNEVALRTPRLPPFIDWVCLKRLSVGQGGQVDLLMQRYAKNVGVEATRKDGPVEVVVVL